MGLKKLSGKIAEYNKRLKQGKVSKIKPDHVEKVLKKLKKKSDDLGNEISQTKRTDKKARLKKKLDIANQYIERAEYLLREVQ
jgi:septal ring factor EnvC (AmiA/AmiB activator)